MHHLRKVGFLVALVLLPVLASAQTTTGDVSGIIVDAQKAPLSGVTVHATNTDTGATRDAQSDKSGVYRLPGLQIGTYQVVATLPGMQSYSARVVLNVGRDVRLDIALQLAGIRDEVKVTASSPLISTRSSSVGEVVDLARIEALPLNGQQFANLAATVPGVGLGFHSDSTKSTQYSPQISGGNGRNINYVIDGGDNNDDTVGGLLQLFPLEA